MKNYETQSIEMFNVERFDLMLFELTMPGITGSDREKTVRAAFLDSITALAYALEARDKYTSGHSLRVTSIATAIAREMNLPECEVQKIRFASLVHDIGKIGVKESVLNKSSSLSQEEYDSIKRHCEVGERILSPVIKDAEILKMVRHHHERFDGKGYPDGLAGERIPLADGILRADIHMIGRKQGMREKAPYLGASIIAVADSFDAMTTDRPYRSAMRADEASRELRRQSGQQFDPTVVDAFLGFLNRNGGDIFLGPLLGLSDLLSFEIEPEQRAVVHVGNKWAAP